MGKHSHSFPQLFTPYIPCQRSINAARIITVGYTPFAKSTISRESAQHVRDTLPSRNDVIRHVLQSAHTGLDGKIMSSHLTNLLLQYRPAAVIEAGVVYCPFVPKPRRSKLRPRKAAVKITPDALYHLRELLDQPNPKMIRVGVKNRGCSGLAYHLEYVEKPAAFDEVVEQDGVKVLIDSKALFSIIGSEMDWKEDKLSARFVFNNPNITEQCGCGESFSVS